MRAYHIRGSRSIPPPLQPLRPRMAPEDRFQASALPSLQEHQVGRSPSRQAHMPRMRKRMGGGREAPLQMPRMQEHGVGQGSRPRPMQGLRAQLVGQRREVAGRGEAVPFLQVVRMEGASCAGPLPIMRILPRVPPRLPFCMSKMRHRPGTDLLGLRVLRL